MAAGEAVAAEGAAWVAATDSTPEENGNLTDTVAVTDRKFYFVFFSAMKQRCIIFYF